MDFIRPFMAMMLTGLAFALIGAAIFSGELSALLRVGLLVAGIDLIATVCGRPLIKPGPIARSMYPGLRDE